MADKLLIVHGYSDGSTSFDAIGKFFIKKGLYRAGNVFYLDYSSMDDEATFQDFADKLDADHRTRLGGDRGDRIDVVCHSTGSLVVRAWLALHAERVARRRLKGTPSAEDPPCPVDRLVCLAPANFGSDLAGLGQSFLGKIRSTFFNQNAKPGNFMESGKRVLQGLEPASPFQWDLSFEYDLHGDHTYFSPERPEHQRCYPFVLAAGEAYDGLEARLVKQRALPGTDGTVRIAGTSLNTRGCSVDFRTDDDDDATLIWWPGRKFPHIPFAVCAGVNHGSIIDPTTDAFNALNGPGTLAVEALSNVRDLAGYQAMAERFDQASEANYVLLGRVSEDRKGRYQQFFFRVRDDVNEPVDDFYVDFHVVGADGSPNEKLTLEFDDAFKTSVYRHSASGAHRVVMLDCQHLGVFGQALNAAGAKLMVEVTGVSALPDVSFHPSSFLAYPRPVGPDEPSLLYPNTTTLVDIILNRRQTDALLVLKDTDLKLLPAAQPAATAEVTGRGALLARAREQGR